MGNGSPVFIVDDDQDDKFFIKEIWKELDITNPLYFFENGRDLIAHLTKDPTTPFLILSDVNLPVMDGFELRKRLLEDSILEYKSIPFIFWSNKATNDQIKKAYHLAVQGFFIKDSTFEGLKNSLVKIFEYWCTSKQPVD